MVFDITSWRSYRIPPATGGDADGRAQIRALGADIDLDVQEVANDLATAQTDINTAEANITALQSGYRPIGGISGSPVGTVRYTASGTFSKATYSPARIARVTCVASGAGGGGSGAAAVGQNSFGSGGGGGEWVQSWILLSAMATNETVTVGTGGAGNSNAAGSSGIDTSFGALVVAKGGAGGTVSASNATAHGITGGNGGTGGTGDQTIRGAPGGPGWGDTTLASSGMGGASGLGWGPGATNRVNTGGSQALAGNTGGIYGGGGSGSATSASGAAAAGGPGGAGICIVELFL